MIYKAEEFILKNGLHVTLKTPEKSESKELLDSIMKIASQSPFFNSSPEDLRKKTVADEEAFIESFQNGNNCLIAVYAYGKIIGNCSMFCGRHIKDKHRCSIGIGIDESYCDMGIGSLLFDEIVRIAGETEGVEQIELGVFAKNERARHLYEKKGFSVTGIIPHAAKQKDGTYDDEIMMTKFLCD